MEGVSVFVTEMDKKTAVILVVILNTKIQFLDVRFFEKALDTFLERPTPFTGNDLDQRDALRNSLCNNICQIGLNRLIFIVYGMQIEF